jgi:hypothetical protein
MASQCWWPAIAKDLKPIYTAPAAPPAASRRPRTKPALHLIGGVQPVGRVMASSSAPVGTPVVGDADGVHSNSTRLDAGPELIGPRARRGGAPPGQLRLRYRRVTFELAARSPYSDRV